jgi:phosphoribosylanthranilate isomerase
MQIRIKICGVTRVRDAEDAAQLGADAVGLNFYQPSPRHVEPALVPSILRALPPFVEPVGVFVNEPLRAVCATAQQLGITRLVQWHGDRHEVCDVFPHRLICAFQVRERSHLAAVARHLDACRAQGHVPAAILVDAQVPGQYGGTGQVVPWDLLAEFQPGVPLVLAGGLTPENVAESIRRVRPHGVDVASGVESSPGVKDLEKMRRFIANVREAAAR